MRPVNKKVLLKSDYLRKEAELYIDYVSKGEIVNDNKFMCKSLKEINEGTLFLNSWVYEQTIELLNQDKLVVLLGGDHSTPLGYLKALAEKHGDFGILQIDAHCDLRDTYEGFVYSHASIMYNTLREVPQVTKLVQAGIRDYSEGEWQYIQTNSNRITTFFMKDIVERQFEGETWKQIEEDIVSQLPDKVYLSFDIDVLDRKLCPNTGTPVPGGLEFQEAVYLIKKVVQSGRKIIGFDLCEVTSGDNDWDANVGARMLFQICHWMGVSSGKLVAMNVS